MVVMSLLFHPPYDLESLTPSSVVPPTVIGPALSDPTGGVGPPTEALDWNICETDWKELGVCEECVRDEREGR